jgi:hypothetical protein
MRIWFLQRNLLIEIYFKIPRRKHSTTLSSPQQFQLHSKDPVVQWKYINCVCPRVTSRPPMRKMPFSAFCSISICTSAMYSSFQLSPRQYPRASLYHTERSEMRDLLYAACNCNDSLAPPWTDALLVKVDDSVCCVRPEWKKSMPTLFGCAAPVLFIEMDFRWCSSVCVGVRGERPQRVLYLHARRKRQKPHAHTHHRREGAREKKWNVLCVS